MKESVQDLAPLNCRILENQIIGKSTHPAARPRYSQRQPSRVGALRFWQWLKASDGMSQGMRTVTLRSLERDGLVLRTVFDIKPPSAEYRLTETGESLLDPITALTHWTFVNEQKIASARAEFEKKRDSGRV